jgi:hypothetical protein
MASLPAIRVLQRGLVACRHKADDVGLLNRCALLMEAMVARTHLTVLRRRRCWLNRFNHPAVNLRRQPPAELGGSGDQPGPEGDDLELPLLQACGRQQTLSRLRVLVLAQLGPVRLVLAVFQQWLTDGSFRAGRSSAAGILDSCLEGCPKDFAKPTLPV